MASKKKAAEPQVVKGIVIHAPTMVDLVALNAAVYNPRKIAPEKFENIKNSIRLFGFYMPVVVQKKGMVLVAGHQRIRALRELCIELSQALPQVHAIVLDIDDRTAKKINLLDNNLHGEFDPRKLAEVLLSMDEDKALSVDETKLMGFEDDEVGKLLKLVKPQEMTLDKPDGFARSITLSLQFTDIRLRDALKKALTEKSETAKKMSGDLVASVLGVTVKAAG